jgi:hypothetical protein
MWKEICRSVGHERSWKIDGKDHGRLMGEAKGKMKREMKQRKMKKRWRGDY